MSTLPHPGDTIAALASAPGGAERGIVRISGPRAADMLDGWFVPAAGDVGSQATRSAWRHSGSVPLEGGRRLPAQLLFWPGRRSYTGEPVAELHTLGSPPLLEAVLDGLCRRGARLAQPGEFTLRAFLAGRIDLTQAEAVLGVIDAPDDDQLRQALAQLAGSVSAEVVRLRGDLLDLLADLEAGLDFAEEDIEFVSRATLVGRIGLAREAVRDLRDRAAGRLHSNHLPRVVLTGPPNAGKSTLFNALAGRKAAIVSHERGTTRDHLTAEAVLGGVACLLIDTAGAASPRDAIESAAQGQRREQLAQADLVLCCESPDAPSELHDSPTGDQVLHVHTKSDRFAAPARTAAALRDVESSETPGAPSPAPAPPLFVSARTGAGLAELAEAIASRLRSAPASGAALVSATANRCRDSLRGAADALERGLAAARAGADSELLAIELREALTELGKVVGAVYTDDLLDRIFSRFCIGK